MQLRVLMREDFREASKINREQKKENKNHNMEEFTDKSDTQFKKAVKLIVSNIEVEYAVPEEKVIVQNRDSDGSMYIILNGTFDV